MQWFNLRLQLIGVGVATGVAALAVVQHQVHAVDPALVGLAIAYALSLTAVLGGVVTSFVANFILKTQVNFDSSSLCS